MTNRSIKTIIVTGGAGFIGSAVIRHLINETNYNIVNIDKLTYAGNLLSLKSIEDNKRYTFIHADICDEKKMNEVFTKHSPNVVMHLAAESHVDRSIDEPSAFIQTNIIGTYVLLETARNFWLKLNEIEKENFIFHHVSTDEVYGDLSDTNLLFTENTAYDPSSPYSASKAGSDHLVRAWHRTYGLPTVITNCSNNYGPYHFPEKLIPLIILNALKGKKLPVYGDGSQIRDWLYVEDHAKALVSVATSGIVGKTYNIGGHNEKKNIEVVSAICAILDDVINKKPNNISSFSDLITFVNDRPGHDLRYAIDATKILKELKWQPQESFESGIKKTILWYLDNLKWCQQVQDGIYQQERLGNN